MAKTSVKKTQSSTDAYSHLRKWNGWLAVLCALEGGSILLLSVARTFPVQTSYQTIDPIASQIAHATIFASASRHLFDLNLAYIVAVCFGVAALAYLLAATSYRVRYEADLKRKVNVLRWSTFALTSSLMVIAVALLAGISDLSTLLALVVLSAATSMVGLSKELLADGKAAVKKLVCGIGCAIGVLPWLIVAVYIFGAQAYGTAGMPGYVYWLFGSMVVLFGATHGLIYLQHKGPAKWRDYLFVERAYMVVSFVTMTVLAWQMYAGTLRP